MTIDNSILRRQPLPSKNQDSHFGDAERVESAPMSLYKGMHIARRRVVQLAGCLEG